MAGKRHGFEQQLEAIADKQALLAWVQDLPDNVEGVILVRREESDNDVWYSFKNIGPMTVEVSAYMAQSYLHWLFGHICDKE